MVQQGQRGRRRAVEGIGGARGTAHRVRLLRRSAIGERTLEIVFSRPDAFRFVPGQCIRLVEGEHERDYSLASGPDDPFLSILVRRMEPGVMTSLLASAAVDRPFLLEGPRGFFTCRPSSLPVVLVATGTGAGPYTDGRRGIGKHGRPELRPCHRVGR